MDLRRVTLAACLLAVAAPLGLAACGDEEPGVDEPAREGLALELDDITYNVFITRQLNPRVPPDGAYVTDEAPPGETLYGVFIQVCNHSDEAHETVSDFVVKDNQENEFEPEELPEDNAFAYSPRTLDPDECIPQAGSVAQLGPSAGSMLLFQLPLQTTENRPLELEMEGESGETLTFELDI
ncbi:MAG TPA: hypothetical protein VGW14_05720 [Thermoleophilaceae bacterium]|nr:hypothetical protein [Thermoleophilaceae bacterium]